MVQPVSIQFEIQQRARVRCGWVGEKSKWRDRERGKDQDHGQEENEGKNPNKTQTL